MKKKPNESQQWIKDMNKQHRKEQKELLKFIKTDSEKIAATVSYVLNKPELLEK